MQAAWCGGTRDWWGAVRDFRGERCGSPRLGWRRRTDGADGTDGRTGRPVTRSGVFPRRLRGGGETAQPRSSGQRRREQTRAGSAAGQMSASSRGMGRGGLGAIAGAGGRQRVAIERVAPRRSERAPSSAGRTFAAARSLLHALRRAGQGRRLAARRAGRARDSRGCFATTMRCRHGRVLQASHSPVARGKKKRETRRAQRRGLQCLAARRRVPFARRPKRTGTKWPAGTGKRRSDARAGILGWFAWRPTAVFPPSREVTPAGRVRLRNGQPGAAGDRWRRDPCCSGTARRGRRDFPRVWETHAALCQV